MTASSNDLFVSSAREGLAPGDCLFMGDALETVTPHGQNTNPQSPRFRPLTIPGKYVIIYM
jgi:hypothetical protein